MKSLSAFLLSEPWERFQQAAGYDTRRDESNNLYIARSMPGGNRYWQASRCHIPAGWTLPADMRTGWFSRLEPEDTESLKNLRTLGRLKETVAYQPRQTSYLDLGKSDEKLRNSMKPKHRYNLGLAIRRGVTVESYHENLKEVFPRFWRLLSSTTERQGFRTHTREYFETLLATLEGERVIHIFLATREGIDLAGLLLVTYADAATYLHGGSADTGKEHMAPYLLQWEAICFAQRLGLKKYDFWGTHAEQDQEGVWQPIDAHPSYGTTRFKLGFGGEILEYPGTYDLVIRPIPYTLYTKIRGLRSRKRAFS